MSSEKKTYANTTDTQVVVDNRGRILAGGERGEFPSSKQITRALEAGILIEVEPVEEQNGSDKNENGGDDPEGDNAEGTPVPEKPRLGAVESKSTQKRQER